jgi:hypothetical protein
MLGPKLSVIAHSGFGHKGLAPVVDPSAAYGRAAWERSVSPAKLELVPQSKRDDDIRRFGFVKVKASRIVVAPAGEVHDLGMVSCRPAGLDRLHDTEPVAVEEECMLPEQFIELRNHGVVIGDGPGFELAQSSLDLYGCEFHCSLLFDWVAQGEYRCGASLEVVVVPLSVSHT